MTAKMYQVSKLICRTIVLLIKISCLVTFLLASPRVDLKIPKGRHTRGRLLPQHAPPTRSRSKAPSSAPTIYSEDICRATKLLLPSFAPSYQTGLIWGSKLQGQICCTILFQEQAPSCALKFALRERVSGASSLVCTEICFAGACFRSKLPRVYRP